MLFLWPGGLDPVHRRCARRGPDVFPVRPGLERENAPLCASGAAWQGVMNRDRVVIGVDSAERTGFAVLADARLVRHGVADIASAADVERTADLLALHRPDLVCVEAPFVRVNAATGLTLARLLGRWLQAFERRDIPTATVLASTWQPIVLVGRMTPRTKGPDRKLAAQAWALETFGLELPEDEADAAGIAAWAARHSGDLLPVCDPKPVRTCPANRGAP
jgi:Holliday junction resolvasome RuvABC endonuclease subunit